MNKFAFGLVLGVVLGAAAYWYFGTGAEKPNLDTAKEEISRGATKVKESIQKTVNDLTSESVKEELTRTGTIIREKAKAAGAVIADKATDAKITTVIKTHLATEAGVSALNIKVDTTDGLVTLSGTANTHEEVAKAVKVALDTEGVVKVISTLQVKGEAPKTP